MMNDPFVLKQVDGLAGRIRDVAGDDPAGQLQQAWQLVLGRMPSDREEQAALVFLEEQAASLRVVTPDLAHPQQVALTHLCQALVSSNGFLYVE
mgnify:FL=1